MARKKLDIVEIKDSVWGVLNPHTGLIFGYVMHDDVYTHKWWLYDRNNVKHDGHEYDSRSTAVRALARLEGVI